MKKLFTLALILLVATMGYSQIRKVSKNDAKNKVATMQVTKGMENSENVQSRPNKTRIEGELDYTTYDLQTNWSNINRTIVWPDGKINFAYNFASNDDFTDCGTGIGTYDSNRDEWIPLGGRIENEKTNFGSIARYQENGIVVASQTNTTCGVYIVENKDYMMPNSVPATSYLDSTYDPSCPVVMTSGSNRDIIHIIATGSNDNNLYYFRSTDGGYTWDKENEILPYLSEEYGNFWGNNVAYWMETTEYNDLALVVNNPWSDGMVIYSSDNGDTWQRKVFYQHPGINTTFDDWFMYPRWTSCVWGANNELCVAYEFNCSTGEPGSRNYDPAVGGVAFWSESLPHQGSGQPFIMDSDYIGELWASTPIFNEPPYELRPEYFGRLTEANTTDEFSVEELGHHGDYKCGPVAMPVLCKMPYYDDWLVAVWIAIDKTIDGNFYFKLWGSSSLNGGHTWTPQIKLIDEYMFEYELNECVYPQAAVIGRTLVVACQMDWETGTYVNGDDVDPSDNYFQGFTFDIDSFIPPVPPPYSVDAIETEGFAVYPNPANDILVIETQNIASLPDPTYRITNLMGQNVLSGCINAEKQQIDIKELPSGMYFITAGGQTVKFVVK